jgi:catechol 2,3-dioxygenase-like lactoylglutathione lyase family enzyme
VLRIRRCVAPGLVDGKVMWKLDPQRSGRGLDLALVAPVDLGLGAPSQAREAAHIAFAAADRVAVQAFHGAAVAHGAEVLRAATQWPEGHAGYGAFVGDPDGNSVEALYDR